MSYATDRAWSDRFIPAIQQIVGPLLLYPASFEEDAKRATDLMVFTARDMRIAARVRRAGYADRFPFEFTIRSHRDSGAETEMSKIINGWGDWLLYGHEGEGNSLSRWWVVDLHAFRAALIRSASGGVRLRFQKQDNGDGTRFVAYDLRSFPPHPPILIAGSHELPAEAAA